MNYHNYDIVFQEVPGEISLCFSITGCRLFCKGCHSTHLWHHKDSQELTPLLLQHLLEKYQGLISCVLFLGGEWEEATLIELLIQCKAANLATALYTGEEDVSRAIKDELTYLKTGRWLAELGGLQSPNTNQKLIKLTTGEHLNYLFMEKE